MVPINLNPTRRELRQFGALWLPLFLCALAFLGRHESGSLALYGLLGGAAASLLLGLSAPRAMRPVFVGATLLTYPIGFVVSHIILGAVYYLVVTPTGRLLRLGGRDPMSRTLDREAASYWEPAPKATTQADYFKQY